MSHYRYEELATTLDNFGDDGLSGATVTLPLSTLLSLLKEAGSSAANAASVVPPSTDSTTADSEDASAPVIDDDSSVASDPTVSSETTDVSNASPDSVDPAAVAAPTDPSTTAQ